MLAARKRPELAVDEGNPRTQGRMRTRTAVMRNPFSQNRSQERIRYTCSPLGIALWADCDSPIVGDEFDPIVRGNRLGAISVDVGDEGRFLRQKVLRVELKNFRQTNDAARGVGLDIARLVEEASGLALKVGIEGRRAERPPRQPRASRRHAIQSEV